MASALVTHPHVGSVWLDNARIEGEHVVGEAWDDTGVGSPMYPEGWRGEPHLMNFPKSCIRKWQD